MIVVIADDLTGAAELAGAALAYGLSAEVQTVFEPDTQAEVVCVDTDTRMLPPDQAAACVAAVARAVVATKPAWLFKKCDSVLRGPVLAEARATAAAAGKKRLLILPANPSRQRIIRGGRYLIDGRPLDETAFAHDPAHPRTSALVTALLGEDLAGVETPDIETEADLARLAATTDRSTLSVGAADFFTALLQVRVNHVDEAVGPGWAADHSAPAGPRHSGRSHPQRLRQRGIVDAAPKRGSGPPHPLFRPALRSRRCRAGTAVAGMGLARDRRGRRRFVCHTVRGTRGGSGVLGLS